jgi:hypothetical protein
MPAIKFRDVDFIDFDTLLDDEERLVRDRAGKFIEDNLVPIIEECNRAGRFPRELIAAADQLCNSTGTISRRGFGKSGSLALIIAAGSIGVGAHAS